MIEIAFSLAIVAFALVAIMGVLPMGMNVQKDNRDDTIINHDAAFWLEALKSGSKGIDDLVNYVEAISVTNKNGGFTLTNSFAPGSQIHSGAQIVALLTTNRFAPDGSLNVVLARVRAINGAAVEKTDPKNEFVFRYELQAEVTPAIASPNAATMLGSEFPAQRGNYGTNVAAANLAFNLQEFRLTLRWPLFQHGSQWVVGRNQRVARGMVSGSKRPAQWTSPTGEAFTSDFIEPNVYYYVPAGN